MKCQVELQATYSKNPCPRVTTESHYSKLPHRYPMQKPFKITKGKGLRRHHYDRATLTRGGGALRPLPQAPPHLSDMMPGNYHWEFLLIKPFSSQYYMKMPLGRLVEQAFINH